MVMCESFVGHVIAVISIGRSFVNPVLRGGLACFVYCRPVHLIWHVHAPYTPTEIPEYRSFYLYLAVSKALRSK